MKSKPSQFQFYTVFQKLIHLPLHLGQAHTSSSTMNSHSMLSQDQHKVGSSSNKSGSWAQLETLLLGRDIQKDLWPKRRFTKRLKLSQQVMFYMELSQLWEPKTVWFIIMFPIKSLSLEYPISPPLRQTLVDLLCFSDKFPLKITWGLDQQLFWGHEGLGLSDRWMFTVVIRQICSEGTSDPKITRALCQSALRLCL